ncbi:hypothetical protein [Gymnodinialimonas hymeniacidonis]|uniref:hypothetical protein n=1 Tax=Gymnodinialimonas hymeniacidonis TaxID=3126508 RepID=UPI0034C5D8C5
MNAAALHPSVAALKALGRPLTDDDPDLIATAHPLTDELPANPNAAEVEALLGLMPANGDTGHGLNWSILHCIEASPDWPLWDLIAEPDHEWHTILRTRLKNGGYTPPKASFLKRLFGG